MRAATEWIPPEWIMEALQALRPPERKSVSEWSDAKRVLDSKTSAMPGRWHTAFTPYLAGIMDSFTDLEVEEMSYIKCTQVGGTEALLNMLGYSIDENPGAAMVVYPTDKLGEFFSQNRLQSMIDSTPELREKYRPGLSNRLLLHFAEMYLVIAGANSPSSLGAYPIRDLFFDEVDKYPVCAGKEADPRALARERTKTYDNSKKIVNISTPTFESGAIWKDWLAADTRYKYHVICPHCGAKWTFVFKQLKFETDSAERARETAVYVCEECDSLIDDAQKVEMVRLGVWEPIGTSNGRRRIAFHLNVFYSPWVRLGDIAYEFVKSKGDPALLMNFINSWLAEPYKEVETSLSAEWLLENRQGGYPVDLVPRGTVMVTGGVDVQKDCFYWTIRAWQPNMTSYNLCHGKVFSWWEIENVMNRQYYDCDKNACIVNLCCVDSGDQTDDVYDFCAKNRDWAVPSKGASTRLQGRWKRSVIDKVGSKANGQTLYFVDSNHYKDVLFARMLRDEDEGGWYLHDGCDPEYCEMMTSEHKVVRKYNGRLASVWEPKAVGRDNHYLDCEVYAALAADLCGIRDIKAQQAQQTYQQPAPAPSATPAAAAPPSIGEENPLKLKRGWFG